MATSTTPGFAKKRAPLPYYLKGLFWNKLSIPFADSTRRRILRDWEHRDDADEIRLRRDFYCRDFAPGALPEDSSVRIGEITIGNFHSRYAIDARAILKYFNPNLRAVFTDGDIYRNPLYPSLIKARRLDDEGADRGVILNLDSVRHFLTVDDPIPFADKKPVLFFRGDICGKPDRIRFFEMWGNHPLFDLGDTNRSHPSQWSAPFVKIPDHFQYQFILCLEGNDMASSLQWVLSSNCIPVMPRPRCEGWLMHSLLEPGKHYIEIAPDFSDAGEKIEYYINHPEEAAAIARASREWGERFNNPERERIIALLVAEKYFRLTNQ